MVKGGLVTVDIGSLFGETGICEYCDRETLTVTVHGPKVRRADFARAFR